MILVTGGAGFIGANFVLDWIAATGEPVVNLDALTYAGNLENLAALKDDRAPRLRARRHLRPAAGRSAAGRAPAARDRPFRRREPRRPQHPRAGEPSSTPTSRAPSRCSRRRGRTGSALDAEAKAAFRFLHVSTDEVYGSLRPGEPPFTEDHRYEPNSPYSASKAASDHLVRAWHHTYGLPVLTTNCSNNYGPYHFPEKLIPLMIVNALAGKPLPVYGDGQQVRDWLYVKDHCAAIRAVLARGTAGRDLQHRRLEREAEHRDRADDLRAARRAAPAIPTGSYARLDHLRDGPAGPRPPLRDRRAQDRARARLEAGRDLRERASARPCAGTSTTPTGSRGCRAARTATGSRRTTRAASAA